MKTHHIHRVAASLLLVGLLSACGGGSHDVMPTPETPIEASNTPPASASESPEGMVNFVSSVVTKQNEDALPLDMSQFNAPMDAPDSTAAVATANDDPVKS